jgi:uncharacterized Zn finger protein
MNRTLLVFLILLLPKIVLSQDDTATLLQELDQTIQNIEQYSNRKEAKIDSLKKQFKFNKTELQKQAISQQLYDEYRLYKSDSALVYARKNVAIALKLNDTNITNQAYLDLASIMGTLGMYKEAIDILSIKSLGDNPQLKGEFYNVNRSIYGYMADYASSKYEKSNYLSLVQKYRDSALNYVKKQSVDYTINTAEALIAEGAYDEAIQHLQLPFETIKKDDPNRAVFAYIISNIYQKKRESPGTEKMVNHFSYF